MITINDLVWPSALTDVSQHCTHQCLQHPSCASQCLQHKSKMIASSVLHLCDCGATNNATLVVNNPITHCIVVWINQYSWHAIFVLLINLLSLLLDVCVVVKEALQILFSSDLTIRFNRRWQAIITIVFVVIHLRWVLVAIFLHLQSVQKELLHLVCLRVLAITSCQAAQLIVLSYPQLTPTAKFAVTDRNLGEFSFVICCISSCYCDLPLRVVFLFLIKLSQRSKANASLHTVTSIIILPTPFTWALETSSLYFNFPPPLFPETHSTKEPNNRT